MWRACTAEPRAPLRRVPRSEVCLRRGAIARSLMPVATERNAPCCLAGQSTLHVRLYPGTYTHIRGFPFIPPPLHFVLFGQPVACRGAVVRRLQLVTVRVEGAHLARCALRAAMRTNHAHVQRPRPTLACCREQARGAVFANCHARKLPGGRLRKGLRKVRASFDHGVPAPIFSVIQFAKRWPAARKAQPRRERRERQRTRHGPRSRSATHVTSPLPNPILLQLAAGASGAAWNAVDGAGPDSLECGGWGGADRAGQHARG